jgi:SNF2 family DNA or RNA helicase
MIVKAQVHLTEKPVVVQKFIAKGTIEEKVLKLQEKKKNLLDQDY